MKKIDFDQLRPDPAADLANTDKATVMTCAEIRAQLAALLKERDQLAIKVETDQDIVNELQSEVGSVNPVILAKAKTQLAAHQTKLKQLDDQIAALRNALEAQGCFVKQPQQILEIQYANPDQVKNVDALSAQAIALGKSDPTIIVGGGFPSLDAQQEWKQVLPADLTDTAAHDEDYEGQNLVGATGWVLNPEFSGGDVPFDHPFGFDWEFMLALDQPADDPKRYTFLLTPGDQAKAFRRQELGHPDPIPDPVPIPNGPDDIPSLLGVEIDGGLVPKQFSDPDLGVVKGDRMAVFGRWIVDCGHQLSIKDCDRQDQHPGIQAFRTEIHPPLLMAAARVTTGSLLDPTALNAPELTRVVITSRPYLVSQRFTVDTNKIYDDTAPDDGTFVPHMINEVLKVNQTIPIIGTSYGSQQVEAHPKIKSFSLEGSYELHLIVKPPPVSSSPMLHSHPLVTCSLSFATN